MVRQLIVVAAVLSLAGVASAQVNNQAAAEALFLEGRELMKAKSYAAAAEKFAASDRADPSVGARINLGDCYQAQGKTASAWSSYKAAVNLARQKQDSRRAELATQKANALTPKLTFLIVKVATQVDGQTVTIDGKPVSQALWGQRIPVDPGTLEVAAAAPQHEPFSSRVSTGGPGAAVTVDVPALEARSTTDRDPRPEPEPRADPITQPTPPPADDRGSGRRYLGLGVGAGGVVALGVGLGFGASARSKWNGAFDDGLCDEQTNVCTPEGQAQTDTARSHATVSTVAVAAGAVMIGAGVVLYLTAPDDGDERRAALAPVIGPDQVGVGLSGAF